MLTKFRLNAKQGADDVAMETFIQVRRQSMKQVCWHAEGRVLGPLMAQISMGVRAVVSRTLFGKVNRDA